MCMYGKFIINLFILPSIYRKYIIEIILIRTTCYHDAI